MQKHLFIVFFVVLAFSLTGCATTYDKHRQELAEAHQSGRITTDQYMAALSVINQQQTDQIQALRSVYQTTPVPSYLSSSSNPKQYTVYNQQGQQIGTAQERKPFMTPEEMAAMGLRPSGD